MYKESLDSEYNEQSFLLVNLYQDYIHCPTQKLIKMIEDELKRFLDLNYEKTIKSIRECIKITTEYTNKHQVNKEARLNENGEHIRVSGEPYINHPLRVALILIHERLFDTDVLIAAIMHDLFEDTTYTYEMAKATFGENVASLIDCVTNISETNKKYIDSGLSPEEIDYAGIVNKCNGNKIAFYIKFADRLDNLMTIESMPPVKQEKKIADTKKYLLPLLMTLKANRFITFINNAIYLIEQRLIDSTNNEYTAIENRAEKLCLYDSTWNIYKHLRKAFCVDEPLFREVRIIKPSILEISAQIKHKNINANRFSQSQLVFETFLVANDGMCPKLPTVLQAFLKSRELNEYAIENINYAGFDVIDDIRNHYHITIITDTDFNTMQYGSSDVEICITTPNTIDDDFATEKISVYTPKLDKLELPIGSSVIDFAFRIHKEVGDRMIGARVKLKGSDTWNSCSITRSLKDGDTIEIITSTNPYDGPLNNGSLTQINWLMSCATKNAKRIICKIIQNQIKQLKGQAPELE